MNDITFTKDNAPVVLIGDVLEKLKQLKESNILVDTIITSPPYWNQRDYGMSKQIGNERTAEEYIANMLDVATALKSVLKDNGSFFLNIGDKYTDKNLNMIPFRLAIAMQSNGWVLRNVIIWYKPNHMPSSIKDRLVNTWEPVFFFVKATANKYTPRYYANIDEIRVQHTIPNGNEPKKTTMSIEEFEKSGMQATLNNGNGNGNGNGYKGKFSGVDKINLGASPGARASIHGEYWSLQRKHVIGEELKLEILTYLKTKRAAKAIKAEDIDAKFGYKDTAGHWFRTDRGGSLPKVEDWAKLKEILDLSSRYDNVITEQHYVLQDVAPHKKGKNPGDFWSIATEKLQESHFAIFPTELSRRIIKGFCPENGIVLDPFAGSGTTGKAARELNRKSILIDINSHYVKVMKKRCGGINLI